MEKEAWCLECKKEVKWNEKEHYEHSVISLAEKLGRESFDAESGNRQPAGL